VDAISLSDVEGLIGAVIGASDPTAESTCLNRKKCLLQALAKLIEAQVWIWNLGAISPYVHGDATPVHFVDGGWSSPEQRAAAIARMLDPGEQQHMLQPISTAVQAGECRTFTRPELVGDDEWAQSGDDWRTTGLDEFLVSVKPLSTSTFSSVAFYRPAGAAAFGPRDRQLVHLAVQHVDWLHRHGVDLPTARNAVGLAPRPREALVHLLAGESKKGIAAKMGISEHTVNDYLKEIYRHFGVRGRGELFAWMTSERPS
jgi:DNA-binding CsgD family transcriptional regulator